jgi:hypothetical protein
MTSMRDEFSLAVQRTLAQRVAGNCSNPDCQIATSGPHDAADRAVNIGVAAHVTAASPNGPRYKPALTPEERRSPDNGIWLCQNCAKLVDNDTAKYPVDVLRTWKMNAEAAAQQMLGERPARHPTVNAAVVISGPGAIQIRGPNAVNLGPNAITIVGPVFRNDGEST